MAENKKRPVLLAGKRDKRLEEIIMSHQKAIQSAKTSGKDEDAALAEFEKDIEMFKMEHRKEYIESDIPFMQLQNAAGRYAARNLFLKAHTLGVLEEDKLNTATIKSLKEALKAAEQRTASAIVFDFHKAISEVEELEAEGQIDSENALREVNKRLTELKKKHIQQS